MNYYNILDIPQDATQDKIKKAFIRLVIKSKTDEYIQKNLVNINKAYNVLKNPQTRKEYDSLIKSNEIHNENNLDNIFNSLDLNVLSEEIKNKRMEECKKYLEDNPKTEEEIKKYFEPIIDTKNPNLSIKELQFKRNQEDIENIINRDKQFISDPSNPNLVLPEFKPDMPKEEFDKLLKLSRKDFADDNIVCLDELNFKTSTIYDIENDKIKPLDKDKEDKLAEFDKRSKELIKNNLWDELIKLRNEQADFISRNSQLIKI